jgi:hypothetical protein
VRKLIYRNWGLTAGPRLLEPLVKRQIPPQLILEPEPRHSMLYE